jgi:hypothetical protein
MNEERFTVDGRTFIRFPVKDNILIFWERIVKDTSIQIMLGAASSFRDERLLIRNYFAFSFCRGEEQEGLYPWHIRRLVNGKRKFNVDIDTASFCWEIAPKEGSDLIVPVNIVHCNICPKCSRSYVSESLHNEVIQAERNYESTLYDTMAGQETFQEIRE